MLIRTVKLSHPTLGLIKEERVKQYITEQQIIRKWRNLYGAMIDKCAIYVDAIQKVESEKRSNRCIPVIHKPSGEIYPSMAAAAKAHNTTPENIWHHCRTEKRKGSVHIFRIYNGKIKNENEQTND